MKPISTGAVGGGFFRTWNVRGQVPSRDNLEAMRLMSARPTRYDPQKLLDHTEPRMTVDSVLDGLGLDSGRLNSWKKFLEQTLHSDNEVISRRDIHSRMLEEKMEPALRRAILQRSVAYRRHCGLSKGIPRGGRYYRRVPRQGGGYRYYYDPSKYSRSRDVHVDGQEAAREVIQKTVSKFMDKAGAQGCPIDRMRGLSRRYGPKLLGEVLDRMRTSNDLTFKDGKLYRKSEPHAKYVIDRSERR